jgi:hypothetical protein
MSPLVKRISTFALAVTIGFAAFGLLWLPMALAVNCPATPTCPPGTTSICYKGTNYPATNVYPSCNTYRYLTAAAPNTGTCGACPQVSQP